VASLELLLEQAARAADWHREVLRRCAWCARVADASGTYHPARGNNRSANVTTDGMCSSCGEQALARLALRAARRAGIRRQN